MLLSRLSGIFPELPISPRVSCPSSPSGGVAVSALFRRFVMDCKQFRKHHLAYLDDTLPGDAMAGAQHHVMVCNGCAAHDTLVRRSLMVARSMPTLTPSDAFQQKLRARLAECREERAAARLDELHLAPRGDYDTRGSARATRTVMAVAASAVLGLLAYQALHQATTPELSMQPVIASRPAPVTPAPYVTPQLLQVMSTGNPVWPAAIMIEDAPVQAMQSGFSLVSATR